ncbi:MAG: DNA polymerase III subunit delta' [Hyphomicrobium sp.]
MARAVAAADIEEMPEADRLDGFPHPRMTARLYGHEAKEAAFAAGLAADRLHHGWLVTGPEGVGKATLAYRMARYLLALPHDRALSGQSLDVPDDSPSSRQVRALSHPGLLLLRRPYDPKVKRFKTEIPVDEVRRLRSFLNLTAAEGQYRVVLIDTADDLNANAANAVLKSLEEPPGRTVFILLSASPGRLLPTVRSRCRTLDLAPLGSDVLKRAVVQAIAASGEDVTASVPSGEDWQLLERLAGGSVRRVLSLQTAGGLELQRRLEALISSLPSVDWPAVHMLADELSSVAAETKFNLFQDLLASFMARLIRAQATGVGAPPELALAHRLIGEGRLAAWASLWETLAAEKAVVEALNLDRKTLILQTFARLEASARA